MNLTPSKTESSATRKSSPLVRNLIWMVWSGVVGIANSVLLWIFIARMRETEELGRFTIVMGLYALFFTVCSMGLVPFLVSEISRRSEKKNVFKFLGSAAVFLFVSGLLSAVLMTASVFFISESPSVRIATAILSLAMIPTGLIYAAETSAIAYNRTHLIAFVTTFENILRTVIPLGLLYGGFDIAVICISFVAVRFFALAIYFLAARKFLPKFSFSRSDFKKILKVTPTFGGTVILSAVNWQAAVILLGRIGTETELAKFGAASRFLIPVTILMASYASVIQPVISRFSEEESGWYLAKMVRYPLILATCAAIASPFLSPSVLTALFGEKYADVAPTLDILAVSVVPFCLVMVVARGLVAANLQHIDFWANAVGVAAVFAAGFWLIPLYGAKGAAIAQLISFGLMAVIEIFYFSKKNYSFKIWRTASLLSASIFLNHLILWN